MWMRSLRSSCIDSTGFNRYMVECESRSMWRKPLGLNVLIDTWWNVNTCPRSTYNMQISFNRYMVECESTCKRKRWWWKKRFNRYMVECEFRCLSILWSRFKVLIDTWWNVNRITAKKKRARTYVLIDTWWNVNMPVNAITDNRYRF